MIVDVFRSALTFARIGQISLIIETEFKIVRTTCRPLESMENIISYSSNAFPKRILPKSSDIMVQVQLFEVHKVSDIDIRPDPLVTILELQVCNYLSFSQVPALFRALYYRFVIDFKSRQLLT